MHAVYTKIFVFFSNETYCFCEFIINMILLSFTHIRFQKNHCNSSFLLLEVLWPGREKSPHYMKVMSKSPIRYLTVSQSLVILTHFLSVCHISLIPLPKLFDLQFGWICFSFSLGIAESGL